MPTYIPPHSSSDAKLITWFETHFLFPSSDACHHLVRDAPSGRQLCHSAWHLAGLLTTGSSSVPQNTVRQYHVSSAATPWLLVATELPLVHRVRPKQLVTSRHSTTQHKYFSGSYPYVRFNECMGSPSLSMTKCGFILQWCPVANSRNCTTH